MRKWIRNLVIFCGTLIILFWLGQGRLRSFLVVQDIHSQSDAIVLLAGSFEERMPLALSLYRTGRAGQILLTDDGVRRSWSREHQRNLYTTERGINELVKQGVARQSITALPFSRSGTVYDAVAVRDFVVKHNIRSILLVTSDYHTRRSLWIFRKVLQPLPVTIGIVPSHSSSFSAVALECCKLAYYFIRYGVLGEMPGSQI
jgi:uncharacterized SAM-binding protein YcdF (DUF218 family)